MNKKTPVLLFAAITSLFTGACGDTTSGIGELGRVQYMISTHYVVPEDSLNEVEIVTGHEQVFDTLLTQKGSRKASDPSVLRHRVRPSDGATISQGSEISERIRSFSLNVSKPGTYTIQTMDGSEVFDYIELAFEEPTRLSLVTWTRNPDEDDWDKQKGNSVVKVKPGTQVTILPVPMDAAGNRLVGDVDTSISATPDGSVVLGENILAVYEQRVVSTSYPVSLYFLESGDVDVKLRDQSNDVKGTRSFKIRD